jgi:hypothetical protein
MFVVAMPAPVAFALNHEAGCTIVHISARDNWRVVVAEFGLAGVSYRAWCFDIVNLGNGPGDCGG